MLIDANIFQPLIDVFEAVLKFFHNGLSVPWGWSIVLLTVVVRVVLLPLTVKQIHSMQRLQQHMPELKAIQNKYKEDKQRQQQEVMKFYKENNVNPFASCLPLVAQLPVFIALFYMLRQSLRHDICPGINPLAHAAHTHPCGPHGGASFLFINDLTNKATGATLIVLLLLYVATQLGASLMMSSPTMDKTQRQIMLVMPLFFVIFFIQFPAGLLVYWITTNAWMIVQQLAVRRILGPVAPPATAAAAAAGDGRAVPVGAESGGNGAQASSGLVGLLNRIKPAEPPAAVSTTRRERSGPPPPPPRKKKKRSGRRR
jgi:YidC/Oxa1 family membrane protein insertase